MRTRLLLLALVASVVWSCSGGSEGGNQGNLDTEVAAGEVTGNDSHGEQLAGDSSKDAAPNDLVAVETDETPGVDGEGDPESPDASEDLVPPTDVTTGETCIRDGFCAADSDCQPGERCNKALTPPQCYKLYCSKVNESCDPDLGDLLCGAGLYCIDAQVPYCADCKPVCGGKACGDDGCGGSCGTCAEAYAVCVDGTCCAPNCTGKTCGDDGCGGSCGVCPATFTGNVFDFQTKAALVGASVQLLDDNTGSPLAIPAALAGANGQVEFASPSGTEYVGVKIVKAGQKDTYLFRLPAQGHAVLWSVSVLMYNVAPPLAGLIVDSSKGLLLGGVYFVNAQGQKEGVGCSTVLVTSVPDPATFAKNNLRYFGASGLPTTLEERKTVNPGTPLFLANAVPVGKATVAAAVGELVIGDTYGFVHADSVTITDIITSDSFATNPMPPGCGDTL